MLQSGFQVGIAVSGRDLGIWMTRTGGGVSAEVRKTFPGGGLEEIGLVGRASREDITMTRLYTLADAHAIYHWLDALVRAGGANVVPFQQPLGAGQRAVDRPITWRGILMSATPPEADSNSNDNAILTIGVAAFGGVG